MFHVKNLRIGRIFGALVFGSALFLLYSPVNAAVFPAEEAFAEKAVQALEVQKAEPAIDRRDYEGFVWRLDSAGKANLPRNFRTAEDAFRAPDARFHLDARYVPSREGMAALHISGSAAFTPEQLKNVAENLRGRTAGPLYDVDLRQESHGFLDGIPVSWYGERDWANIGKRQREACADERRRLKRACGHVTYIAPLGKHKLPEGGMVRRITQYMTEKEAAEAVGMHYFRIAATDHIWPGAEDIDRFLRFYRTLPKDAWLHFHCEAGVGRTTAFMVMTDMLQNPAVSLRDILYREHEIGGFYYGAYPTDIKLEEGWKVRYYEEKVRMLAHFYDYVQENHADGYQVPWSVWLKAHPIQ